MGFAEEIDAQLTAFFASWNIYSSIIALSIMAYIAYSLMTPDEPDTHPMLLLRQSSPAAVRQAGQSSVYRNNETPHGYPLKSGLNVRPPGSPMYTAGRDGDIRDIWRRVVGEIPLELPQGRGKSEKGKILTVFGRERVEDVDLAQTGKEIAVIGSSIKKAGGRRVAVHLPNSIELLAVVFAGAFYGLDVILLPYNQAHIEVVNQIKSTNADVLIAEAGALPLGNVVASAPGIKQVIWVVEQTSRHMDWTEVSEDVDGKLEVNSWHELVRDAQSDNSLELPADGTPGKVVFLSQQKSSFKLAEFTQKNMVAAIAALVTALPPSQRFSPSDLFLPADSLTVNYTLCMTLAALFQHTTVALNSVAGPLVDIAMCSQGIAPTIICASAIAGDKLYKKRSMNVSGFFTKLAHSMATKTLQAGRMPVDGFLTQLNAPNDTSIGSTPGKLRLLFLAEKAGGKEIPLSSAALSDLRVYTGARVIYALTAPAVAGAVAQTSVFDYRTGTDDQPYSHFGSVVSSIEAKVVDWGRFKTTDDGNPQGEIVVTGPAVVGGEAKLGLSGRFNSDGTLAYITTDGTAVL